MSWQTIVDVGIMLTMLDNSSVKHHDWCNVSVGVCKIVTKCICLSGVKNGIKSGFCIAMYCHCLKFYLKSSTSVNPAMEDENGREK